MTKQLHHLTSDVEGTYTLTSVSDDFTRREECSAPWMPLDGLAQEWATFGQEALSAEGSLATSHAFLALSAEQQALREYERREEPSHASSQDPWLVGCSAYDPCLTCLQEAATQWGHAARVLTEASSTVPSGSYSELAPTSREELRQGICSALQERLRVTTISLSVLTEQARSDVSCPSRAAGDAQKEVLHGTK